MGSNICNICGAAYVERNGKFICPACGAYRPEDISSEEETLLFNASQTLRLCNFDDAAIMFEDIIARFPNSSKGYWGLMLADYGIKYETDYNGKKIPTCYATSYESVYNNKNYLAAVKLADKYDKEYYETQAEYLEEVRKEWITKASKEKPYDIFIAFRDTELENDIQRTRDSYEAAELYNHLVKKGYNVFFSRESLKNYGEHYEPYIFNALNTARVMIVYGTSPENVTSTWVKNEWTRYAKKIANREKAPNSLVLCYHGFNPATLPNPIRTIQAIDVNTITWLERLDSFIATIFANSNVGNKLQKDIIKQQVGKKAATINNSINDRIIGAENKTGIRYTINEKIGIADKFIANNIYDKAEELIDTLLSESPNDGNAIMRKFVIDNKLKNIEAIGNADPTHFKSIDLIDKILKFVDIMTANDYLKIFYDCIINKVNKNPKISDGNLFSFVELVVSYNFEKRDENVANLMDLVIANENSELFEILLAASCSNNVDQYSYWLERLLTHQIINGDFSKATNTSARIFEVDEGNTAARRAAIRIECRSALDPSLVLYESSIDKIHTYDPIRDLLRFETKEQQIEELGAIIKAIPFESMNLDFYTELLKYYPDNVSCFSEEMLKKGNYYLAHDHYDAAKYLFTLLSQLNPKEAIYYFYVIMARCRVHNEKELIYADDILSFDEYIPMLANANEEETVRFLGIVNKQRKYREEFERFAVDRDSIMKAEQRLRKIYLDKDRCEKVYNYCVNARKKDKRTFWIAFTFAIIGFSLYSVVYLLNIQQIISLPWFTLVCNIGLITLGGILGLTWLVSFVNRLRKTRMFRKFNSLTKEENYLKEQTEIYRDTYEYYDKLVEISVAISKK